MVDLANPYDAQRIQQMAAQKANYQPNPVNVAAPAPGLGEQATQMAANAAMKGASETFIDPLMSSAMAKGKSMAMSGLSKLGLGAGSSAATGGALGGASPLASGLAGGTAGAGAMGGAMTALGTAVPYVGLGLLAGKAFGLFNQGGFVNGPLSKVRYKRSGGEVTEEIELSMGPLSKGV